MTYYKGITVTFKAGVHEDDIEHIVEALRLYDFVTNVSPIEERAEDQMTRRRIRGEMVDAILKLVREWDND